jgi:hypothetical protein
MVEARTRALAAPHDRPLYVRWKGYSSYEVALYWQRLNDRPLPNMLPAERFLLRIDLLFPFLYGSAFALALLSAAHVLGWPLRQPNLVLVPVAIAVLADWIENLVLLAQLERFAKKGHVSIDWIQVASAATTLKTVAVAVSMLACVALGSWLLYRHASTS